jgi:hypothetical protein
VSLDELRAVFEAGDWERYLYPPDEVLLGWQAAILQPESAGRLRNGLRIAVASLPDRATPPPALCRAYTTDGDFVGVARFEAPGVLAAAKMFGR